MPVPAVIDRMRSTLAARALAGPDMPALLMVSGGSDSTALAYLAAGLREAGRTGENVEAVARRERYLAANEALESLCRHAAAPLADGRIVTAHTADDRVESFYMRSIVGTGPGGFRAMRYRNGPVVRPLLDASRDDLRA